MIDQGMGGDIVYISSKNSLFAGPNNIAYGATKADQAHQVRLLAAELGRTASGSTGSTPTGSSAAPGSSPAAGAPSGPRCTGSRRRSSARTTPSAPCWAGGAARARRRRRVRPHRRRPVPDHRAAHPGRLRRRRRVPAMSDRAALAAVDLGASSGRVMLGRVGPGHPRADRGQPVPQRPGPAARRPLLGRPRPLPGHPRRAARRRCARSTRWPGSAIDSWGVDYGLLDADGVLRGNPRALPRPRTEAVIDEVHQQLDPARLYAITGLQFLPFNTLYQLARRARPARRDRRPADPGPARLLAHRPAGPPRRPTPRPPACSTPRTGRWAPELVEALGLPAGLLPDVVPAGAGAGAAVAGRAGRTRDRPRAAGHHRRLARHRVGGRRRAGHGPEVRLHLLRHVGAGRRRARRAGADRGQPAGELHQRARRGRHDPLPAQRDGPVAAVGVAAGVEPARAELDLQDLLAPRPRCRRRPADRPERPRVPAAGRHAGADRAACRDAGERVPETPPEVVRCILDSLAAAFAEAIDDAERLSGHPVEVVHVVGGGSQNTLLCQLTADAAGARWWRVRWRRPHWGTCWSRPGPTVCWRVT